MAGTVLVKKPFVVPWLQAGKGTRQKPGVPFPQQ